jgi:hypothetical protein
MQRSRARLFRARIAAVNLGRRCEVESQAFAGLRSGRARGLQSFGIAGEVLSQLLEVGHPPRSARAQMLGHALADDRKHGDTGGEDAERRKVVDA